MLYLMRTFNEKAGGFLKYKEIGVFNIISRSKYSF